MSMRVSGTRFRILCLALLLAGSASALFAFDTTLVAAGSTWKYLANGSNQGTAWRASSFDDSVWPSGPAQLGYGDGDEQTVVPFGPNANQKYITTYFRRAFTVADPGAFNSLNLATIRDDGAVVYLNGVEVWRSNMPATFGYQTLAAADAGSSESTFVTAAIPVSGLVAGQNVLAVEIHQNDAASSDMSFDLRLVASTDAPTAGLTRGPYLQMGTPTSVRVRWRTDLATNSRVRYGTAPASLTSIADVPASVTNHEVTLTGLAPATRYYYSIGSTTQTIAGGDASHFFVTSPLVGTATPTRLWILGDSGTANNNARAVRDAYLGFAGSTHTNLWLMLGDNAYTYGTDEDYQFAVFDMYPTILRQSVLWPTLGNHDTAELPTAPPDLPYFAMFSLPTAAEAGGVPSGTEKYYSFDYGNIHFICLDSMTSDRTPTGPMLTWLQNDLESTSQQWIIAFWHHPPYSKGSHDSDQSHEVELRQMRQNALPILEGYGVDLVLSGHSHSYERSYLLDSHYGSSGSLISAMKKDAGNGRVDGTGAYEKSSPGMGPHEGAVYVVAGSSGLIAGGALNHPAMFISLNNLGSMVLDVDGGRLDAKFLRENGAVADYFTIIKGTVDAPTALSATAVSATRIDLQWTDNANNEDGFRFERCTGTAAACDATPANFALLGEAAAGATTYSDTTAAGSTTYSYRVRTFNSAATSSYTNTAEATTPAALLPPAAPSALAAVATSTSAVELTWVDDATNEDGFRVERCTGTWTACDANPALFAEVAQLPANAELWADSGRTAGATYTYRVLAFNAAGNSPYSDSDEVTMPAPPTAPTTLAATPSSTSQIDLTWTDTAANEEGFRVERCTGTAAACTAGSYTQIALLSANTTAYASTGLAGSTTYSYRVIATNASGDSAPSNTATATTATPCSPAAIAGQPQSGTIVSGNSTTLSVTATGTAPLSYQWYTGTSGNTTAPLAGQTSASTTVAPTATTSYWVRITNGCGTVNSSTATVTVTPPPVVETRGDFNRDGRADLFWRNGTTASNFVWFMNGTTATQAVASSAPKPWVPVVFADFNSDGKADVLWRQPNTGETSLWLMNGATYTTAVRSPTVPDLNATPVGSGDFNGDGKADILWRNSATGTNFMWLMNGITVTEQPVVKVPKEWDVSLAGDLNGDGKADVFWRNRLTGETSIWLMNGAVYTTAVRSLTVSDLNMLPVAAGDFDADGKTDLFWHRSTGQTWVWLMNGTTVRSTTSSITVPAAWKVRGAGDFNADRKADLFWWNGTTGETSVWLMNGATAATTVRLQTVTDTNSQPVLGK